jgi:hypothetical protein
MSKKQHKHNKQNVIQQTIAQGKQNLSLTKLDVNDFAIQSLRDAMNKYNDKSTFEVDLNTARNILVLDKDTTRVEWFEDMFGEQTNNLDFAGDVADARKLINKNKYDLIFVWHDLHHTFMASIDDGSGYEFVYNNNITQNSNTPLVLHGHNAIGSINIKNIARGFSFIAPYMFFSECIKIKDSKQ